MYLSTINGKLFCNLVKPIQFKDGFVPTLYTTRSFTTAGELYYVRQNILYMHDFDDDEDFTNTTPYIVDEVRSCYELKITPTYLVARCSCIVANETQFQHGDLVYDSPDGLYVEYIHEKDYATTTYAYIKGVKYDIPMIFSIENIDENNVYSLHIKDDKMRIFVISYNTLAFGEYDDDYVITKIGKNTFVEFSNGIDHITTVFIPHGDSYYTWICESKYDINKLTSIDIHHDKVCVTIDEKKGICMQMGKLIIQE